MIKQIEAKGETIDAAVQKALLQLGLSRDDVSVEILEKPRSGFLGIGREPALVRVTYQTSPAGVAKDFLEGLLYRFGAPATVVTTENETEKTIEIELSGDNMGLIIGRRGDTLDAMQYLTSIVANRDLEEHWHVALDTENYRSKREVALQSLAAKMAQKALKYKKSVALEPMKPHERRVIHASLQDCEGVTTYSVGSEPNRKVIVAPVGAEPQFGGKPSAQSKPGKSRPRRYPSKKAPRKEAPPQ